MVKAKPFEVKTQRGTLSTTTLVGVSRRRLQKSCQFI